LKPVAVTEIKGVARKASLTCSTLGLRQAECSADATLDLNLF
jgi:hypothetical protein